MTVRSLLAAGTLLDSEWQDVAAIVVQVRKRREYPQWRLDERGAGVILEPATFVLDAPGTDVLLGWRFDRSTLAEWRVTLAARIREADVAEARFHAAVASAERRALPELRDALVEEIGRRQTPAESPAQVAERLSRELCIDLRAAAGQLTDRVSQAIDSVQSLLVSARSGRFSGQSGGSSLAIGDEVSFDLEWEWLVSYPRWRSAMRAFAYPENQLQPNLYQTEFVTATIQLAPTQAYLTLMAGLAQLRRLTPDGARGMAAAFVSALRAEVGSAVPRLAVPAVELTDRRTNAALTAHRTLCLNLVAAASIPTNPITKEQQIPQFIRELFWLVPVALARKLQDSREYAVALDWYQTVFAYQWPLAAAGHLPGTGVRGRHRVRLQPLPGLAGPGQGAEPALHRAQAQRGVHPVHGDVHCGMSAGVRGLRVRARRPGRERPGPGPVPDRYRPAGPARGGAGDRPGRTLPGQPGLELASGRGGGGPVEDSRRAQHRGVRRPGRAGGRRLVPAQPVPVRRAGRAGPQPRRGGTAGRGELPGRAGAYRRGELRPAPGGDDLRVAEASLSIHDLKVTDAGIGVRVATMQRDKSQELSAALGKRLGLNSWERLQLEGLRSARSLQEQADIASRFSGFFSAVGGVTYGSMFGALRHAVQLLVRAQAGLAAQDARIAEVRAGFERRGEEWELQRGQADRDVEIGNSRSCSPRTSGSWPCRSGTWPAFSGTTPQAVADFLATKFTNAELYEWMSGVLGRVYAYFLQQATALAQLAQAQLAFERQELRRRVHWRRLLAATPRAGAARPRRTAAG